MLDSIAARIEREIAENSSVLKEAENDAARRSLRTVKMIRNGEPE